MTVARTVPAVLAAAALTIAMSPASSAAAQQAPPVQVRQAPAPVAGRVVLVDNAQASETRERLIEVLSRYSPSIGQVLKLDPSLLSSADYLAPYPALAQFLGQHPEVARDPGYFLEQVRMPPSEEQWSQGDRERSYRRETLAGVMFFVSFLFVACVLAWVIKTLLDYRRWLRLSKMQADAHNKLLDRFAANEELLRYVESEAGRRFLESAPIALESGDPAAPTPLRRILWAVQAGCILAAAGVGLLIISRVVQAIAPPMLALGVLAIALGVGFVLAAGASFLLSKRLGLVTTSQPTSPSA